MSHSPSSSSQSPAAKLAHHVRGLAELAGVPMDDLLRELAGDNAANDDWLFIPPAKAMALMINAAPFIDGKTRREFAKIKRDANAGPGSSTLRTDERGNIDYVHLIDFFRLVKDIQIDLTANGQADSGHGEEKPPAAPEPQKHLYQCTGANCKWTGDASTEYCPKCGRATELFLSISRPAVKSAKVLGK